MPNSPLLSLKGSTQVLLYMWFISDLNFNQVLNFLTSSILGIKIKVKSGNISLWQFAMKKEEKDVPVSTPLHGVSDLIISTSWKDTHQTQLNSSFLNLIQKNIKKKRTFQSLKVFSNPVPTPVFHNLIVKKKSLHL